MSIDDSKRLFRLEMLGVVFIVFLGSGLHFTYKLSGENPVVAVFSAVNESVWEHLKLGFWPALLYAVIEYAYLGRLRENFLPSKAVGIYVIPFAIIALYYSYRAFLEESLTY